MTGPGPCGPMSDDVWKATGGVDHCYSATELASTRDTESVSSTCGARHRRDAVSNAYPRGHRCRACLNPRPRAAPRTRTGATHGGPTTPAGAGNTPRPAPAGGSR